METNRFEDQCRCCQLLFHVFRCARNVSDVETKTWLQMNLVKYNINKSLFGLQSRTNLLQCLIKGICQMLSQCSFTWKNKITRIINFPISWRRRTECFQSENQCAFTKAMRILVWCTINSKINGTTKVFARSFRSYTRF